MTRKQLTILVVLAVIIGAAGIVAVNNRKDSWNESSAAIGQKLLPNLPVNDVTEIHIKGASDLSLVKKDDTWRVHERGDYPANYSEISEFILKAADLKVVQAEQIGASQLARMELEDPTKSSGKGATLLEFKGTGGKPLQAVLLGKKHERKSDRQSPFGMDGMPDGRYVMRKDDPKDLLLVSDPLSNVEPNADHWLNKDFFKVEKAKSIQFISGEATNSWKLTRETESAPWKLVDAKPGEVLDTNKVSSLGSTLNSATFVDVSTNSAADSGLDKPVTFVVETFDGFTYNLKVGKRTPENNFYASVAVTATLPKDRTPGKDEKPEDKAKLDKEFADKNKPLQDKLATEQKLANWTYVVSSWMLDPLVRNRPGLMVEPKKEDKKNTASTVSSGEGISVTKVNHTAAAPAKPAAK
jgi:hypothetical protein